MKEEKSVSLNEEQRLKEKKETEARTEARKKELRARPLPNYKTYEFTLKNVGEPGLPAPVAKTNTVAQVKDPLTNTVAKVTGDDDEEGDNEDANLPTVDITLDEGRRILQDLIALTSGKSSLAGRP